MKKLLIKIYTIVVFTLFSTAANASGMPTSPYVPYSPYQPYQPHVPVDTGLVTGPIYTIALVLFVAGIFILLNTQALKTKFNLD